MTINVNIAIIVITMLFQCSTTLATDSDLWFPKQYPSKKLIKCGFDHEMFGLSLVDGYLYQFEKCAVIIYPPPLDKYLDKDLNQLKLENGYRYTFEEIQPNWKPNYCEYAKITKKSPFFLMDRLKLSNNERNNHIILYFIGLFNATSKFIDYHTYDFDLHTERSYQFGFYPANIHYILLTNGYEQFLIHNSFQENNYELMVDQITKKERIKYNFICIREIDNKNYFISRTTWEECDSDIKLTHSLLKSIIASFTVYEKILMISKHNDKVLITDVAFLQINNSIREYPLEIKSLNDFFYCKSNIVTFILLAIIFVIFFITIIGIIVVLMYDYYMIVKKTNKKKLFDNKIMSPELSSKIIDKLDLKTIISEITDTTLPTTITDSSQSSSSIIDKDDDLRLKAIISSSTASKSPMKTPQPIKSPMKTPQKIKSPIKTMKTPKKIKSPMKKMKTPQRIKSPMKAMKTNQPLKLPCNHDTTCKKCEHYLYSYCYK